MSKPSWTAEQEAAIEARSGEAVVVAGAGSGKTGVLAEAVAKSIVSDGIDPDGVLAITFTRKAAAEMSERIRDRILELDSGSPGSSALTSIREREPSVSTIDSFCQGMVRRNALELGVDPRFRIIDEEAVDLMERAWRTAMRQCGESFGDELKAVLAKYDDNHRMRLQSVLEGVWTRLRSGGIRNPRIRVPAGDWALEAGPLHQRVQGLAADVLAESASWKRGEDGKVNNNEKTIAKVEAIAAAPLGRFLRLGIDKASHGSSTEIKGSAALEELSAACAELTSCLVSEGAAADLRVLAAMLERFDVAYSDLKADQGCLDFADLAILSRDLLASRRDAAADGIDWRPPGARFERVFLDESQDVNQVQAELIGLIAPAGGYYSVGDAAQSIYRFRHAEVSIFNERARRLELEGRRFDLSMNFRSKSTILDVVNDLFTAMGMDELLELRPAPHHVIGEGRVELLLADATKVSEAIASSDGPPAWLGDVIAVAWRQVEADAVAERVQRLLGEEVPDAGTGPDGEPLPVRTFQPADITILSRTVTGLIPFAEALRARGIPATIEGAGGLWGRPEVSDLAALLAVVGNARNEERLYQLLYSPMCGISLDGLVVLAAEARAKGEAAWETLRTTDALGAADSHVRGDFVAWLDRQRALSGRRSIADAIEAALVERGYDAWLLGLPEGERRLANVRRMPAIASDWEKQHGADIASFAREADARRTSGDNRRDGEAVVEQAEGSSGAVRLTTIHKAKGLQYPVTIVSDLAHMDNNSASVLSVSADGEKMSFSWRDRVGAKGRKAFTDEDFEKAEKEADLAEEDRILYVGLTRPEGRLILSGAIKVSPAGRISSAGNANSNLGRILAAGEGLFGPGLSRYGADQASPATWVETLPGGSRVTVTVESGQLLDELARSKRSEGEPEPTRDLPRDPAALDPRPVPVRAAGFSYSGLQTASRCAFRWYAEEVVNLSPVGVARDEAGGSGGGGMAARDRGIVLHGLLERAALDGAAPSAADAKLEADARDISGKAEDWDSIAGLAAAVMGSTTWARLRRLGPEGGRVAREEGFAVALPGIDVPLRGVLDVFAELPDGRVLVIDWKSSDKADGAADLTGLVEADYGIQREAYAYAALSSLRGGVSPGEVEVVHLYAERPDEPVSAIFTRSQLEDLADGLASRAMPLLAGDVAPTDRPWAGVCSGCAARGRICPVPVDQTRRSAPAE